METKTKVQSVVEHICAWCGKAISNNEDAIREWLSGEKTHKEECAKEFANSRGLEEDK